MTAIEGHAAGASRPEDNAQRVRRLKPAGTVRMSGTLPTLESAGGLHLLYEIAPVSGLASGGDGARS